MSAFEQATPTVSLTRWASRTKSPTKIRHRTGGADAFVIAFSLAPVGLGAINFSRRNLRDEQSPSIFESDHPRAGSCARTCDIRPYGTPLDAANDRGMGATLEIGPSYLDAARGTVVASLNADTTVHADDAASQRSNTTLYPKELEASIFVKGGRTFELRPIRADDEEKLLAFHHHLSVDSIYCRYFSYHPELSPDELHHLTHVDYVSRLALVIEDGGDLVGVARYERDPETSAAEVAFVVRDDYQHLGLGHRLFASLAAAGWARGVTTFTAATLGRNHDMISVFRHSGFPVTSSVSAGEVSVRLSIDPQYDTGPLSPLHTTFLVHPWS
jgi:GNAT superfamily N-acetyltransferase